MRDLQNLKRPMCHVSLRLLNSTASSLFAVQMLVFSVCCGLTIVPNVGNLVATLEGNSQTWLVWLIRRKSCPFLLALWLKRVVLSERGGVNCILASVRLLRTTDLSPSLEHSSLGDTFSWCKSICMWSIYHLLDTYWTRKKWKLRFGSSLLGCYSCCRGQVRDRRTWDREEVRIFWDKMWRAVCPDLKTCLQRGRLQALPTGHLLTCMDPALQRQQSPLPGPKPHRTGLRPLQRWLRILKSFYFISQSLPY